MGGRGVLLKEQRFTAGGRGNQAGIKSDSCTVILQNWVQLQEAAADEM